MYCRSLYFILIVLLAVPVVAKDFVVKSIMGVVEVRRGVSEEWKQVKVGDLLKPEDTMRTGRSSSATIESEKNRLTVPPLTMLDLSDVRQMSQEDFLLKLAMENILAVPPRDHDEIMIPSAAVLHGSNKAKEDTEVFANVGAGRMQLQGARVLFDNAYYATSILKSKATLRNNPDLRSNFDARMLVAQAFEKLKLNSEAVTEYSVLAKEDLATPQLKKVQSSLDRLKQSK